jgi:hypothetical protein
MVEFVLWMLPFAALAAAILYIGYVAYAAQRAKVDAAARPPPGPDPADELERVNTEIARQATVARQTLEAAREAVRRGTR